MNKASLHRAGISLGVCAWLILVGTGFRTLWLHAYTPGPEAAVAERWPEGIQRDASRPTLIMLVHAECGCSDASLGELARIMARTSTPLSVRVIFTPVLDNPDPRGDRLWARAAALPGVALEVDSDGSLARRFGALVSGQTLLFDRDGVLLFSGGITAARAHAGDNAGADAILETLSHGRSTLTSTPVFGCLLHERVGS